MSVIQHSKRSSFPSLVNTWFTTSVEEAVQKCITEHKIFIVYVSNGDDEWLSKWFKGVVMEVPQSSCVWLKVISGTEQYTKFEEMYPCPKVPSIYIMEQGKVLDILQGDIGMTEFGTRLCRMAGVAGSPKRNDINSSVLDGNHSANSVERADSLGLRKEQVDRQLKMSREERNRVISLIEWNSKEREAMRKRKKVGAQPELTKPAGSSLSEPCTSFGKCYLLIKLTNGVSLKHEFKATDTLKTVRIWVDINRNDGDQPYQFYRNILRETFSDSQEQQTLEYLELMPRSALILKPIQEGVEGCAGRDVQGRGVLTSICHNILSWWQNKQIMPTRGAAVSRTSSRDTDLSSPSSSKYASPVQSPLLTHNDCNDSELSIPSRCVSPNVYQFHGSNNEDEDRASSSYNRNAVNFKDT